MHEPLDIRLGRRDFLQIALLTPGLRLALQRSAAETRFVNFDEADPIVRSGNYPLPQALSSLGTDAIRRAWPQWVRVRDGEIRNRLQRGEEDTLANFVMFGTSFTSLPRVTPDLTDAVEIEKRTRPRIQAFVDALAASGNNERLVLLSALISRLGYSVAPVGQRERLAEYVTKNITRYVAERRQYQTAIDRRAGNDTAPPTTVISDLYKDRGLSLDTDFRPNYAIEAGLAEAKRRGLLSVVRRVAIIGPGLDFTDKDSGFDHYPLQTLQPFAVLDSLVRLRLSTVQNLRVSVFDISSLTLDHVSRAIARARSQQGYTVQLVLDQARSWSQPSLSYWQRFGTAIGEPVEAVKLPAQVQNANRRAVRIRPDIVRLMDPLQLNAVLQRVVLDSDQRYDLIVGTNILIYYGAFEQALALSNVESMLAANGVFLTNDLTREYPGVRVRPVAVVRVPYSGDQEDQIQIYSRSTFRPQLPPA